MRLRFKRFVKSAFREWIQKLHSQITRYQGLSMLAYALFVLTKGKTKKLYFQKMFFTILT